MVNKILISFAHSNDEYDDITFKYFVNQAISSGSKFNFIMIFEAVKTT